MRRRKRACFANNNKNTDYRGGKEGIATNEVPFPISSCLTMRSDEKDDYLFRVGRAKAKAPAL